MEAINKIKEGIDSVLSSWDEIIWDNAKKSEDLAVSMNQKQLESGELPTGQNTPLYKPNALKKKESTGRLFGDGIHWSLHDSGEWYRLMYMKKTLLGFEIDTTSKTRSLLKDEPERFMGLSENNELIFINKIYEPIMVDMISIILK